MEPPLRFRLMNTVLLTGILFMYVVYDSGFRFWMSRSDATALNAAILHGARAPVPGGAPGLTFEAAAEATPTPPLQTYLLQSHRWLHVTSSNIGNDHEPVNREGSTRDQRTSAGSVGTRAGAPYVSHRATGFSDFPMAAVVVESTWLSPDQAFVSAHYAQRLLEGFRYALLTGSPWLLVAGSAEETSLGLQHLRRMPHPAETLFGKRARAQWPSELRRVAESIRESMAPYTTLGAWMHSARSKSIPAFGSSPLPEEWPSCLVNHSALSQDDPSAALHFSLSHLLSVSTLVSAEGGTQHGRLSALILGAEWLRRSDGDYSVRGAATPLEAAKTPHVTVYATGDTYSSSTSNLEGDEASFAEMQQTRVNRGSCSSSGSTNGGDVSWEAPRMWEWQLNGTQQRVHITVPGIVAITVPDANKRSRYAAKALQQLLATTLVRRHARHSDASSRITQPINEWLWWLGRPYGVTIVGGGWEQQRVKLLYIKALREAAAETHESLRRAVQDVHRARCDFEGGSGALSHLCSGARRGRLPTAALPFIAAVPSPPKVFVLPPAFEDAPVAAPQPEWLNYTGELPPSVNPDASYAARVVGRWSYFIYVNYRRWMDWFLASLPGGAYQDHFVLASVLMSDFADQRISWRDVLYLR
ncbi:hypothetical protein ABL78_1974 [Leptomonas seymouri]|uniref:Uncharacterized protein n=1 Tax=Leptomonas seymouri TaxID=5684 RepID=A0A0N0P7L4_LEPSE|nr:hypothetical protein ABL78_1974 [Leptomonas seymouri]|eukprot:KPI88929.1 hypothetical protein ABL78_1974 [Leptomonas seymouri]